MKKTISFLLSLVLLISLIGQHLAITALSEPASSAAEKQSTPSLLQPSFHSSADDSLIYKNQLTAEQLALPTDQLAAYVLYYYHLRDFFYVSTPSDPYTDIRNGFNGLAELEKRPDAASVLLTRFARMMEFDEEVNMWEMWGLWFLISHPFYRTQLNEAETSIYLACKERFDAVCFVKNEKPESGVDTASIYDIIFPES